MSQIKTKFIENSAVTTAKIASSAVDDTKLASNAVTTAKIASAAVDDTKLASNSVTTAKIAAAAVDDTKLASNAITTAKIAADAVTAAKIRLDNNTYIRARNAADSADLSIIGANAADKTVLTSGGTSFVFPNTDGSSGNVLTTDGSGNLSFAPAGSSGANTSLSNLASTAVNADIVPDADVSYQLGSAAGLQWLAAYFRQMYSVAYPFTVGSLSAAGGGPGNSPLDVNINTNVGAVNPNVSSGNILATSADVSGTANSGGFSFVAGVADTEDQRGDVAFSARRLNMAVGFIKFSEYTADPTDPIAQPGDVYFNTISNKLRVFDGTTWADISTSAVPTSKKELITLSSGDITNQYLDLAEVASTDSIDFLVKGGGLMIEGASNDYSVNYTGGAGGKTRITFLNDLATGGASALVAGDVVVVKYTY